MQSFRTVAIQNTLKLNNKRQYTKWRFQTMKAVRKLSNTSRNYRSMRNKGNGTNKNKQFHDKRYNFHSHQFLLPKVLSLRSEQPPNFCRRHFKFITHQNGCFSPTRFHKQ